MPIMQCCSCCRHGVTLQVGVVETKRVTEPQPPFTTSTLQQEASRKLGFSASRTMSVAQKLYEGINIGSETTGLITYMRTDGVQLGQEAISNIRQAITTFKGPAICRPHHAPINQKRPMRRKLMRPSVPPISCASPMILPAFSMMISAVSMS